MRLASVFGAISVRSSDREVPTARVFSFPHCSAANASRRNMSADSASRLIHFFSRRHCLNSASWLRSSVVSGDKDSPFRNAVKKRTVRGEKWFCNLNNLVD